MREVMITFFHAHFRPDDPEIAAFWQGSATLVPKGLHQTNAYATKPCGSSKTSENVQDVHLQVFTTANACL